MAPHGQNRPEEFPVAVIGASTGGPPVVQDILTRLPATTRACVLVAQHMPGHFTQHMAERLAKLVSLPIHEARDGEPLVSGTIIIAPGEHCAEIVRDRQGIPRFHLEAAPCKGETSPSIDLLMRSAAKILGRRVTGFLLTGMGRDGALGMQFIHSLGHRTYVQDPPTCVVDSMVQHAIGCDAVHEVIKPERIPAIISHL